MSAANNYSVIGVDLGGTKVAVGKIRSGKLVEQKQAEIDQTSEDPMDAVRLMGQVIQELMDDGVKGIGVGVPGLVNREWGIVYDVLNIPNWKEVPLKSLLEEKFKIPVYIDNDANCFAMGEYRFGSFPGHPDFVGITLGTGMGSGIIKNGTLLPDAHCCSGEFGTMAYLDGIFENYTSGMYFKLKYGKNGQEVAEKAHDGDVRCRRQFRFYNWW